MENKRQESGRITIMPDIINPGITIPIYDDIVDELDDQLVSPQTEKLGSYRARAGKFSNTLSNLLPSISAKLHHNKKGSSNKANGDETPGDVSMDSTVNFGVVPNNQMKDEPLLRSKNGITIERSGRLTPPQDYERLVHFPPAADYLLNPPRRSNDSFTHSIGMGQPMTRTRNNTTSSQITSISSIAPGVVTSDGIWGNQPNTNDPLSHQQHQIMHQMNNSNIVPTVSTLDYAKSSYYESLMPPNINPSLGADNVSLSTKNSNKLGIPNNGMWSSSNANRQRSQSNASSIYTDAPQYEQSIYSHAPSTYTVSPSYRETPLIADEVDPRSINWVSNDPNVPPMNQISNLLPTDTISISNVYPLQEQQPHLKNAVNLTSTSLATLCSKFGEVRSARTFKGLNIAMVEFSTIEGAEAALDALQGKEVSIIGAPSYVTFAKILPMHQQTYGQQSSLSGEVISQSLLQEQLYSGAVTLQTQGNVSIPVFNQYGQQQPQQQSQQQYLQHQSQPHMQQQQQQSQQYGQQHQNSQQNYQAHSNSIEREQCPFPLPPPDVKSQMSSLKEIIKSLHADYDPQRVNKLLDNVTNFKGTSDITNFGPVAENSLSKELDGPRLRELRKMIDSDTMSSLELEQLAMSMVDELPELSSDYLGNTIVQKLFENSSDIVRDIMLRKTNKYLTSMGIHKNGTWACQKIITMAHTPRQVQLVSRGIQDYCTPLFNDQFGNYVIQCVLKFGFPWNNFIFESIIANFWVIVQNRYGARAVRACLEAHDIITKEQTLILSSVIVLYSEYLATNANGSLLLTWFLDTCVLPNRHSVLAQYMTKHIIELCRHRLASLSILKILNYRGDDVARKITLQAIFGDMKTEEPPESLKLILKDSTYSPTFIYKILCMPLLEEDIRTHIIKQVRKIAIESHSVQQHRRLMEEIGYAASGSTTQNNQQGKYTHRKTNSTHGFNPEAPANIGHMRGPSTSSIRSTGSRQTNMISLTSPTQQPNPVLPNNPNGSGTSYFNYPGMFPGGYAGNSSNTVGYATTGPSTDNDDIITKLERLNLTNGTHLTLPQLSFRSYSSNLNKFNNSNSNNDSNINNNI